MEIDTGAAVSIISKLFPEVALQKPSVQLRTYTAGPIKVLGEITVEVKHKGYGDIISMW